MRTVDYPLSRDAKDVVGSFAVISLDPVASVAPLQDDTATSEAARQSPGRYLAYVKNYLDFQWTEAGPRLTLLFTLGGRGLPNSPDSCQWAAIPISPAQPTDACTRPAVDPIVPLPWDNCYLYTLHFVGGNVSRIHLADEERPAARLSEEGQLYVLQAGFEDQGKAGTEENERRRLVREAEASPPAVPAKARSDDGNPEPDDTSLQEHLPPPAPGSDEVHWEDDGADEQALFSDLFQQDDIPRMKLHFQVWLDLSTFSPDELSDPANVESEIEQLRSIEWDWAQRTVSNVMSKEPETSAWLTGIGDADVPPGNESLEVAEDDELVMPEDAIEHRMERVREDASAAQHAPQSASTTRSDGSEETESQASSSHTAEGEKHMSRSGSGGLSVFRVVLSSISSLISRFRSFIWGLLWRKPFAKP